MDDGNRKFKNKNSQAYRFHEIAWGFMSELGFELDNDPTITVSRYNTTRVRYGSARGFYIEVYFDPADTNTAGVQCGRRWHNLKMDFWGDPYNLSGEYSVLAERLGIDIQSTFKLGYSEEVPQTMGKILQLLKDTLPAVCENASLQDLISVEKEKFGAEQRAISLLGENYEDYVKINFYAEP